MHGEGVARVPVEVVGDLIHQAADDKDAKAAGAARFQWGIKIGDGDVTGIKTLAPIVQGENHVAVFAPNANFDFTALTLIGVDEGIGGGFVRGELARKDIVFTAAKHTHAAYYEMPDGGEMLGAAAKSLFEVLALQDEIS